MTITTLSVGVAVTPTVVKTCLSHYTSRKSRRQKPTAHISYDEGLHLIRSFLKYASHKTVDDVQSFTANMVPHPPWIHVENVTIPTEHLGAAASAIIGNLGDDGIDQIGGRKWWQWRQNASPLRAEWIEMRANYQERKRANAKSNRVMFYVHGGGYFFGSVDEHRYQLQRHARKLNARVLAPRYRLAPQFPFPCGLQDCLAAYLYLLTTNDPSEIILAGDSAGGGMVLTLLCVLRDQNLPLPAGAVLISPWVDLTHSFPSVGAENPLDYLPSHGFHYKPSVSWPPLSEDEVEALGKTRWKEDTSDDQTAFAQGSNKISQAGSVPRQNHHLSLKVDGSTVTIKDQTQMYTTNQLISHPLVSPVLQPSLGGLPPMLVLVGGGEMLRDEQIYVAHKAADPQRYPLGPQYRARYDPGDKTLNKYKPTPVQLQVWEDLCHVAPTLSFTRPAKYMYRSIAQFGAWALSRAQDRPIEIDDDDNISIISSDTSASDTSASSNDKEESSRKQASQKKTATPDPKTVGRAGDPLPIFKHHIIRQQVDRYGNIVPLPPAEELAATSMDPSEVGVIKAEPVKKWLAVKRKYDARYAGAKSKAHALLLRRLAEGSKIGFEDGENPPPSALARRRSTKDDLPPKAGKNVGLALWSTWGSKHDESTIKREEEIVRKEESDVKAESQAADGPPERTEPSLTIPRETVRKVSKSLGVRNSASRSRSRSTVRKRTVSVTDRGQVEGDLRDTHTSLPTVTVGEGIAAAGVAVVGAAGAAAALATHNDHNDRTVAAEAAAEPTTANQPQSSPPVTSDQSQTQSAIFLPKFKTAQHLRGDSDTASTVTGLSVATVSDHASTMAVFSAPGITKEADQQQQQQQHANTDTGTAAAALSTPTEATTTTQNAAIPSPDLDTNTDDATTANVHGSDTPASRRSLERLQTSNYGVVSESASLQTATVGSASAVDEDVPSTTTTATNTATAASAVKRRPVDPTRNPSTMVLVQAEGVAPVARSSGA